MSIFELNYHVRINFEAVPRNTYELNYLCYSNLEVTLSEHAKYFAKTAKQIYKSLQLIVSNFVCSSMPQGCECRFYVS